MAENNNNLMKKMNITVPLSAAIEARDGLREGASLGEEGFLQFITSSAKLTPQNNIAAPVGARAGDILCYDGSRWSAREPTPAAPATGKPSAAVGCQIVYLRPMGAIEGHVSLQRVWPGGTTRFTMIEDGDYYYTIPEGLPVGTTLEFVSNAKKAEAQFMFDDEGELLRGAVLGRTGIISSWRKTKTNRGNQDYRQFRIRKKYGHGAHVTLLKTSEIAPQWTLSGVAPVSNVGVQFEVLDGSGELSDIESGSGSESD